MKKLLFLMSIVAATVMFSSCEHQNSSGSQNSDNDYSNTQVNVTVEQKPVGLDLQALGELAKTAKNAADLETKLNQSGGINDVDLDRDGNVDYLNVVEYGSNNDRGFSITDYLKNSTGGIDTNEIANITFSKNVTNNQVTTNINGNSQIYGNNNSNYSSTSLLTDLILFNYLFTPHGYYYSPYYYGYRPSYYRTYRTVPYDAYNTGIRRTYTKTTYTRVSSPVASRVVSPNANKVKPTYAEAYKPVTKRTYSDATKSQKSFGVRDNSSPVKTTGFANKPSNSSSTNNSSSNKSSSSSWGSNWGSNKSSNSGSSSSKSSGGFSSSSSRGSSSRSGGKR